MKEVAQARPAIGKAEGGSVLPLAGVRVIELTSFWAGPVTAGHLADMGADVVKVESIQRPDGMRFAGAVPTERLWEWSPVFAGANPGKRDITSTSPRRKGRHCSNACSPVPMSSSTTSRRVCWRTSG